MSITSLPKPIEPDLQFLLVRVGVHGQVGRFRWREPSRVARRDRVVCQTYRGVEVGEVLSSVYGAAAQEADGSVLRKMGLEDELLWAQLRQLSHDAHSQCEQWMKSRGLQHVLLDVEPMLDGTTLYFHFLNTLDEQLEEYVKELASCYEQQVAESEFASLLEHGCGPGCGTEQAEFGCAKRGGCAVCSVASTCRKVNGEAAGN